MTKENSMNSSSTVFRIILISLFGVTTIRLSAATAGFDVLVLDADSGAPISGVDVTGWFSNNNGWKAWTDSAPTYDDKKTTDAKGLCHVEGETNTGETGVNIHYPPEGYYPNSFCVRHRFTQKPLMPLMHWRPTDLVITAKLQRVGHTVPLFVKRIGRKLGSDAIMANGESFAYDLVKGAFLPPFGEGQTADVVFSRSPQEYLGEGNNGNGYVAPRYKNTLLMTFQGDEANGILESPMPDAQTYCWIRRAPEEGYCREISFSEATSSDLQRIEGLDAKKCYCFRIRTNRDERGNIKSSLYGKIYGDPSFFLEGSDRWKQKICGISLLYYLNPTPNDRSLEWDRKNNFCDKPGNLEKIVNHNPTLIP